MTPRKGTKMTMNKLNERLGLPAGASTGQALAEIEKRLAATDAARASANAQRSLREDHRTLLTDAERRRAEGKAPVPHAATWMG